MPYLAAIKAGLPYVVIAIFVICLITAIFLAFSFLIKLWQTEPERFEEVRRLEDVVRRANEGQEDAQRACYEDFRILKKAVFRKGQGLVMTYRITPEALRAILGW